MDKTNEVVPISIDAMQSIQTDGNQIERAEPGALQRQAEIQNLECISGRFRRKTGVRSWGYGTGEAKELPLRSVCHRWIKLEFHSAKIMSDGALLAYRELDSALEFTDMAITKLLDGRRGKNSHHKLSGLFWQSVFGRLAGYEDVNDAERLAQDPAMRAIAGRDGFDRAAASSSQMGRFETEWLATDVNLETLTDLSGPGDRPLP
jgi:hypothetical protein